MATDNTLNIDLDQGSSLTYTFNLRNADGSPFNLTTCDARLQVRRNYGDTSILINCTTMNGKVAISLPATEGVVVLTLVPSDTSSIRFNDVNDDTLDCVYDLEVQSVSGKVYKPARGTFTLNREVTR